MLKKEIVLFITLLYLTSQQYQMSPCFQTGIQLLISAQVQLWNSASPSHSNTAGGYNFQFFWGSTLTNISSVGIALSGYRVAVATLFSISVSISFTPSGGTINLNPNSGTQITYATYSVIAVSTCSSKI